MLEWIIDPNYDDEKGNTMENEIRELAVLIEIAANVKRWMGDYDEDTQADFDHAGMLLDSIGRSCDDDGTCDGCGDCRD